MKAAIRLLCGAGVAFGAMFGTQAAITGTVTTIGGSFTDGYVDGNNTVSLFNDPTGLAVDSNGRLLVADFNNNAVRAITTADQVTTTFTRSNLNGPIAVAASPNGNIFVVNYTAGNVVRFTSSGDFVGVFASNLAHPTAITIDSSGNVFVAAQAGGVRRYNAAGGFVQSYSATDGTPNFRGIAITSDGFIAVSDAGNHVIWSFPANGGTAFMRAGTFGRAGFADGGPGVGRLNAPHQIAAGPGGTLVIADRLNHRVRAMDATGALSTLYGVDPSVWEGLPDSFLPGWRDGAADEAELREPVGVAVDAAGAVYDSELFYSLIKRATGLSYPTNTAGGGPGSPSGATQNRITLGFTPPAEASSDFFASPGQKFVAPVTLDLIPGTTIYGLQFNVTITNGSGSPAGFYMPQFQSMLLKPRLDNPDLLTPIDPKAVIRIEKQIVQVPVVVGGVTNLVLQTNYVPVFTDLVTVRPSGDFIGVAWLERMSSIGTNLYNTQAQDLIRYSQAYNNTFNGTLGRVIVGAVTLQVPPNAAIGNEYSVQLGRPSANGDGVQSDVLINPEGARTLKIVAPRRYLVGDILPFRWFNAGDFGDGSILNNDLLQIVQVYSETPGDAPPYGFNTPPRDSDLYDAMDSCCIGSDRVTDYSTFQNVYSASASVINDIAYGDGFITLEDLYVTFRRSLDPTLTNYLRFTSNGQRVALKTTNSFRGTAASGELLTAKLKKPAYDSARAEEPISAKFTAGAVKGSPGQTVHIPVDLTVTGPLAARSVLLRLQVVPQEGTPEVPTAITFTASTEAGAPTTASQSAPMSYLGIWFEVGSSFGAGTHRLGSVDIAIPATANADSFYTVQIERAEASAALTRFPVTTQTGYVIMNDRAPAPWNDEIPDEWRVQYFGSLMNILSAPDADADGDGVSNLDEYRTGTNPTDIASAFKLNTSKGTAEVALKWPSVVGRTYRLESAPALNGATWTVVEDGIAGTGGILQRNANYDGGQARFFRVTAQ